MENKIIKIYLEIKNTNEKRPKTLKIKQKLLKYNRNQNRNDFKKEKNISDQLNFLTKISNISK